MILGSSNFLQEMYMGQWRNFMSRYVSQNEIEGKWIPKYQSEDYPAKLIDQLEWMAEIGFADVDVLWRSYYLRCTEALGVESFRHNLRHAATVYTTERTGVFTSASTARIKGNRNSCIFLAWASGTFSK